MQDLPFSTRFLVSARTLVARLAHVVVWVLIAALFCVVGAAVRIAELRPSRLFGRGSGIATR